MALGDLILLSSSSGVAFDNFDGISLIVLMRENRNFRLLAYASTGSPGHGPIQLLLQSAEEIVFFWDSEAGWLDSAWSSSGCV